MLDDPFPVYRRFREEDPVHWSPKLKAWVLTRYDDVTAVMHDPRISNERTNLMEAMVGEPRLKSLFQFISDRMVFTDPPRHTRLRCLVNKAFTPHAVEAMRPQIQELVDGFINARQARREMDLIGEFAFPLPATVIALMLGLPPADIGKLKRMSDEFIIFFSKPINAITTEEFDRAAQAMDEMVAYFRVAVEGIKQNKRKDLLSAMELAEEQGDRLSEEELFANANLLLVAGHETTTNLIGNGVLALLQAPDQLQKLRDDPSLIPGAIEECLRCVGPVQFTHRLAREDVPLGGKTI